jgi:hypothetical protein
MLRRHPRIARPAGTGRRTLGSAARQAYLWSARTSGATSPSPRIGRRTFLARKTNAKSSAASRSCRPTSTLDEAALQVDLLDYDSRVHREGHEHRQCPLPCRTDGLPSGTSEPSIGRVAGRLRAVRDRQSAASAAACSAYPSCSSLTPATTVAVRCITATTGTTGSSPRKLAWSCPFARRSVVAWWRFLLRWPGTGCLVSPHFLFRG